jgi:hypothetical protein
MFETAPVEKARLGISECPVFSLRLSLNSDAKALSSFKISTIHGHIITKVAEKIRYVPTCVYSLSVRHKPGNSDLSDAMVQ